MKVGVQLPEVEREVGWPELREMALLAEEAHYDSVWLGDHLLYRDSHGVEGAQGPWEAWSILSAIAAVTHRIQIGPLVAATAFHSPALLAKKAATVDEISHGRLVLGLGAGWNRVEFDAFGFPYDRRVDRFAEAFEIVRRLLAGETFDFDGEFHRLIGAELQPRPPSGGPPIMIGSNGPRMLAIALPYAASWNTWYHDYDNDPERLPELFDQIRATAMAAGRDPETLELTAATLVQFGEAPQRRDAENAVAGVDLVPHLRALSASGLDHAQLVLDPITLETIERAGVAIAAFRELDG